MKEDQTEKLMKECCPRDTKESLNFDTYKSLAKAHLSLLKKLAKLMPVETLIGELKRRKVIKFDYIKDKWTQNINKASLEERE